MMKTIQNSVFAIMCIMHGDAQVIFKNLYIKFGANLGSRVRQQLLHQLSRVELLHVEELSQNTSINSIKSINGIVDTLILLLGNSTDLQKFIPNYELDALEPESFRIISTVSSSNIPILACNGLPIDHLRNQNISFSKDRIHYGAVVSSYVCLEHLGFGFLHPLEPYAPYQLYFHPDPCIYSISVYDKYTFCILNQTESPYWPERSFHIHTQHPLELTEVLQGHDIPQFGPHGPHCYDLWSSKTAIKRGYHKHTTSLSSSSSFSSSTTSSYNTRERSTSSRITYCERWEDMVSDVDLLFQWAVANRLNKIEWLLLGNYKWGDELSTRKKRLQVLTGIGHEYSLMIGADCPLGNIQQHAWSMVDTSLPLSKQLEQIRARIDWVFEANFDFITTESGSSEFTHPECELMLSLINEFANYANGTWGREAGIKVHCSTGQKCHNFMHPGTDNQPINFNFLTYYATSKLGIFPHTVQVYALDDPTAGAYGNDNFSYVEDYMILEAKLGQRTVMFYGETAYWVNVDIDVPLFLPLYGQRRLHDLRRIAGRELKEGFRIDGQMNFDSGWEWGYWLSDVITARASWDPLLSTPMQRLKDSLHHHPSDPLRNPVDITRLNSSSQCIATSNSTTTCVNNHTTSTYNIPSSSHASYTSKNAAHTNSTEEKIWQDALNYNEKEDEWEAFQLALHPITRIFGPYIGKKLNQIIIQLTKKEAQLLILGQISLNQTSKNIKKLSGIAYLSGNDPWIDLPRMIGLHLLQPNKVHIRDIYDENWKDAILLLSTMETEFYSLYLEMSYLYQESKLYVYNTIKITETDDLSSSSSSSSSTTTTSTSSRSNKKNKEKNTKNINSKDKNVQSNGEIPFYFNEAALDIMKEFLDCYQILYLRIAHVHALYQSVDTNISTTPGIKAMYQKKSRTYIQDAAIIVKEREINYRIPWERVASWRDNPTVYRFGYLWSVHSLYYWWRDQGLTEQGSFESELSPCYLNRMDITEIAVGWGKYTLELIRNIVNLYSPFIRGYPLDLINCFAPPPKEYIFPRDLYPYE